MREKIMCGEETEESCLSNEEEEFCIDGKRVGIVGSRDYGVSYYYDEHGRRHQEQDLSDVEEFIGSLPPDITIVSGGARGVDTAAKQAAKKFGFDYKEWPADWKRYGKQAGFIRNAQIVCDSDIIIGFWDGSSKGTQHTVTLARDRGKRVLVFEWSGH